MKFAPAVLLLALAVSQPLCAADPATPEAGMEAARKLADGLRYQQGEITLRDGLAKISVPSEFRFLDGKDAATVLSQIWGNPPGEPPLGMLLPAGRTPLDDNSWGVIITYEEDGYVKDDDAAKINYDDLLKGMQKGALEANKEREKAGYPAVDLVGWAAAPRYDAKNHKLHWAKELRFQGADENTLNYNIRMLGRRGVLVLNAVAGMSQMAEIEAAVPTILATTDFQEGNRYTDFNGSTDKVATYGLAALVAGGILAKGGFFKLLFVGLLAAKKFVIIGAVAVYAGIKKLLSKKNEPSLAE